MNRDPAENQNDAADDLREFETELRLRRLSLRSPSPELDAGIARLVRARPRQDPRRALIFAAAAAVAIALGAVPIALRDRSGPVQSSSVQPPSRYAPKQAPAKGPLRVERQVAHLAVDGVIGTAHGVPVQLMRYTAVRQIWYFDPRTGKRLQVTVPRDEAFLMPVRTF